MYENRQRRGAWSRFCVLATVKDDSETRTTSDNATFVLSATCISSQHTITLVNLVWKDINCQWPQIKQMTNQGGRAPARSVRCYNCDELGHFSRTSVKGPVSITAEAQVHEQQLLKLQKLTMTSWEEVLSVWGWRLATGSNHQLYKQSLWCYRLPEGISSPITAR